MSKKTAPGSLDPMIIEARLKLTEHVKNLAAGKLAVICAKKLFDQCQGRWDVYRQAVTYLATDMPIRLPVNEDLEVIADKMIAITLADAQETIRFEGAWEKEREART